MRVPLGSSSPPSWPRSYPHGVTTAATAPGVAKCLPSAIDRKTWKLQAPSPHTSPVRAGHEFTCSQSDWLPPQVLPCPLGTGARPGAQETGTGSALFLTRLPPRQPPNLAQTPPGSVFSGTCESLTVTTASLPVTRGPARLMSHAG